MIELTDLNGVAFILNSNLIETIRNIPETKVLLTDGKFYLVKESIQEIIQKTVRYHQEIYKNLIKLVD